MEHFYECREQASIAAADRIVKWLNHRLESSRGASLVVSGGSTPVRCFAELATTPLDWSRVHILMSDERWVPPDHDDSNEKFVRESLMSSHAADASLLSMHDGQNGVDEQCETLNEQIRSLPIPFACSLLGMGEDGHFASLFPDASGLEEGLEADSDRLCMPVQTSASPHARISLTLAALSRSDEILLLIFGEAKRRIYEQAKTDATAYPVSRLFLQKRAPVRVFWAP